MNDRKWFVILAIVIIFLVSLTIVSRTHADVMSGVKTTTDKIVKPSWLRDRAIKYGLITTFSVAQGTTGLIESAKYGGLYLSNSADEYHVFRLVQDISWVGTGWFAYAAIKQKNKHWYAKTCRIIGAACYARNANELVYRWNVTGSPFNYSDKYTSNKKAIVLLKWDGTKSKLVDFYISGTGKQGAIIDASFFLAGHIFNRIGDIR